MECGGSKVGGWTRADVNSKEVQDCAHFAVDEYNKQHGRKLILRRVLEAWTQVVAGINYNMILECLDDNCTRIYDAMVCDIPWKNLKCLTYFKHVLGNIKKQQVIDAVESKEVMGTKVEKQWVQMQPKVAGY